MTALLALLVFALLFAVFGTFRLGDRSGHCHDCPHGDRCLGSCALEEPGEST